MYHPLPANHQRAAILALSAGSSGISAVDHNSDPRIDFAGQAGAQHG